MKIDGLSLYIEKTLVVGIGDEVTNCRIGSAVDIAISVPMETIESGEYRVEGNTIEHGVRGRGFPFVYRG